MFEKEKQRAIINSLSVFPVYMYCMLKQYGFNLFCNHLEKLLMYTCIFPYLRVKG